MIVVWLFHTLWVNMIFSFKFFIFIVSLICSSVSLSKEEEKVVHVYFWADTVSEEAIRQFEKETGIKVKCDYYDSEEILETKLLTGSSLYDVVMPSAMPYYGRQVELHLYRSLDRSKLSNWKNLDPHILKLLQTIDPGNRYGIPYSWGTTGFVYDANVLKKYVPKNTSLDTYQIILDESFIKPLSQCGVGLLDQPQDLFEAFLSYLKIKPNYKDLSQIEVIKKVVEKVRPYIRFFTSNSEKMTTSVISGEACFVQMWSGEAFRTKKLGEKLKKEIVYVVPREHAGAWCDLMAIPKNAPHPNNAHLFINFMLRPDIAAKNLESTLMTIANIHARELVSEDLRKSDIVFPPKKVLENLKLSENLPLNYERKTIRAWAHIKTKQKR
jgi:putrescine transport system substrate-binding protein